MSYNGTDTQYNVMVFIVSRAAAPVMMKTEDHLSFFAVDIVSESKQQSNQ